MLRGKGRGGDASSGLPDASKEQSEFPEFWDGFGAAAFDWAQFAKGCEPRDELIPVPGSPEPQG